MREDTAEGLLQRLDDGELDLLVFPIPVRREGFSVAEVFREPLWLALPKSHALSTKDRLVAADLKGLTILALETGHSLHAKVLMLCRDHGAEPLLDFATTSLDTLRQMAAMGVGATFLPALYVRAEARQDTELTVIPFAEPSPSRDIGLVWRAQSARRSEYLALAAHIRGVLATDVPEVIPLP